MTRPLHRILGLINARKGSVGVPGKNTRLLMGKPLIGWTIETALKCPRLDRVVVSTDGDEIAGIARDFGADVPFVRPPELAGPASRQIETVRYVLERLEREEGDCYEAVAILQPTCPVRSVEDVEGCINLMVGKESDTVITVVEHDGGLPYALYSLSDDHEPIPWFPPQKKGSIRQELPPAYLRAGSIYLVRRDTVVDQGVLYGDRVHAFVVPRERAFDIDSPFDWALLEAWLSHQKRPREGLTLDPD